MMLYRYLFLDVLAKSVSEQHLQATNDAEALEIGRLLPNSYGIEIWQDKRRVGVALPHGNIISLDGKLDQPCP